MSRILSRRRALMVVAAITVFASACGGGDRASQAAAPRDATGGTPTSERQEAVRGPFIAVRLAALGTVTWRCSTMARRYGLGYRLENMSATTSVSLYVGRLSKPLRALTVQPGQSVRFPLQGASRQRLVLVQATKPHTLRAVIRLTFRPDATHTYCFPYLPPDIDVRMHEQH